MTADQKLSLAAMQMFVKLCGHTALIETVNGTSICG